MNTLDPQAQALLNLLVSQLEEVIPGDPQTYLGYKEAHDALHLEYLGPTYGESLKKQGLLALANWILAEQKPAITGIVIDQTSHRPAKGYFSPYAKSEDDFQWWTDQIHLSKNFDWRPYLHTAAQGRSELSEPVETVDWNHREVEYIVADYFEMFLKELKGERYSKADHRRRLLLRLHSRSEAAVEFKHRNISAVLAKADLPYIDGYKPAKNYQNILEQTVEEYIERESQFFPTLLQSAASENVSNAYLITEPFEAYLEDAPDPQFATTKAASEPRVYGGRRLDYARIEAANRHVGKLGEEFVVTLERQRLLDASRPDLAGLVNCVSETIGDGLGYDVASFETDGCQRYIEVKTTRYGKETPFFLTANELRFSQDHSDQCDLYRVFNYGRSPKIFILQGSLSELCKLDPQLYLASLKERPV
jgi:hypothetical protein